MPVQSRDVLRRFNPLDEPDWDRALSDRQDATIFHTAAWARVLHGTYGFEPLYFAQPGFDGLTALLPVMEVDSLFTGRRGVSLPFTDECPALSAGEVTGQEAFWQAVEFGKSRNWKYLEVRGGANPFEGASPSLSFYTHELALTGDSAALLESFDPSVRRAIRKAEQSNLHVEILRTPDAMADYYALHCKTRKKHGLPPQPFRFFQNIYKHIVAENLGFVALARKDQTVLAAAIFFHFGKKAVYKFGASDEAFQQLRANNLVMWSAIKWLLTNGFSSLHFGRTSLANDGLRRYKQGWHTNECTLDYYKYDLRKGAFAADRDEVFGWHNHVFNRMPAWLARWTGALLYRHIA